MRNPFKIIVVHNEEDFCNRVKERADLLRHARNGSNVVLCSPRRYGKSSLVTVVLGDLREEGFLTAYVDLFPVSSEQDLVARIASAVFRGFGYGADAGTFVKKVKNIFSTLRPIVEIGPEGYSVSVKYDRHEKSNVLLDDLMEGIYNYVKKRKIRACIALDEFQEIIELPDAKRIEGTFRSHIQFHDEISYFFIGSKRRILQDMFTSKSRPFYKSSYSYNLREIPATDFVDFIEKHFEETGKSCDRKTALHIYEKVRGYPYYVQKLAYIVWDSTEKDCDDMIVNEAFHDLVETERMDFEGILSGLTLVQKALLNAIACEPVVQPFARDYLEKYQLSVGGAQKALRCLGDRYLVEKTGDGVHRLTDPILEMWLKVTATG